MFAVKVEYEVQENYISQNKERITSFLMAFKEMDQSRFRYSVFQEKDTNKFIHLSEYQDEEIQKELLANPVFLKFQEERDKNLKSQPSIAWLNCLF